MTEDEVRNSLIPYFETGQITTFYTILKNLGFSDTQLESYFGNDERYKHKKPDGWGLSTNPNDTSFVIECKDSNTSIYNKKVIAQLNEYIEILSYIYTDVVGIIYNGKESVVYYKNKKIFTSDKIYSKDFYLTLIKNQDINIQSIIKATKDINNELHKTYKISNLKHRIIFTACLLLYTHYHKKRWDLKEKTSINDIKTLVLNWLNTKTKEQDNLSSYYASLYNTLFYINVHQSSINPNDDNASCGIILKSISNINYEIKDRINNGQDVLAVLFNEFNHYNAVGSELGQVLTPDYVADLMGDIIDINNDDHILDATCGSGTFLMKAYYKNHLASFYGIELDDTMYALSVINALINNTKNVFLLHDDTLNNDSINFIKNAKINKVLMNPPYEFQYKPLNILKTVLDNTVANSVCAFLMPNNILKKANKDYLDTLFSKHRLTKIIKLPKKVFANVGCGEVSIFVFLSNNPQNNLRAFGCCIEDDGLFTVKNKGRIDIEGNWKYEKKEYWTKAIKEQNDYKYHTGKFIDVKDTPYYKDEVNLIVLKSGLINTIIDKKTRGSDILLKINEENNKKDEKSEIDEINISSWHNFKLNELFEISNGQRIVANYDFKKHKDENLGFIIPVITASVTGFSGYYNNFNAKSPALAVGGQASGMDCVIIEENVWVLDSRKIAVPKKEVVWSWDFALLVCYELEQYKKIYSYGNAVRKENAMESVIKLPIKKMEDNAQITAETNFLKLIDYEEIKKIVNPLVEKVDEALKVLKNL